MSAGRKHERMRAVLVISEVALACVLLVGAGLLLRSFLKVLDVDLGFQPSRAAVIKIDYDDGNDRNSRDPARGNFREMLRNIDAIPGVEASGVTDMLPLGRNRSWGFQAKGKQYPKEVALAALVRIVTPGYLDAMGMHLIEGRDFNWQDTAGRETAVIINQAAARRFWPGEDPVGRLALVNGDTRVIGLISDVREHSLEFSATPGDVSIRGPGGSRRRGIGGADQASTGGAGVQRDEDAALAESGSARSRISSAAADCGPRRLAAALLCDAGGQFRDTWSDARFARNLRRHLLFGYAADAGDRHSNGPGRHCFSSAARRHRASAAVGASRSYARDFGIVRSCKVDRVAIVRDQADGSSHVCGHRGIAVRSGVVRWIPAGSPSLADRSDDRAPNQLSRDQKGALRKSCVDASFR